MKKTIFIIMLLSSANAFSENFDFTAFSRELEELELNKETSQPIFHIDEISKTQAGNLKQNDPDAVEMDEAYKIIPLPGLESRLEEFPPPKRMRSK